MKIFIKNLFSQYNWIYDVINDVILRHDDIRVSKVIRMVMC